MREFLNRLFTFKFVNSSIMKIKLSVNTFRMSFFVVKHKRQILSSSIVEKGRSSLPRNSGKCFFKLFFTFV